MNRMTPNLRQPLLWCAVLIIELLSLVTPVAILTVFLIMIPMLVLYLKLDLRPFILAYISSLFVLFAVLGGSALSFFLIIYSLFFIPPTIAMGHLYKKAASIRAVFIVTILVVIGEILILLLMGHSTGMDPIGGLNTFLINNLDEMPEQYRKYINEGEVERFTLLLPLLILLGSAFYVLITHAVTRKILKKSSNPLPGLPPIRDWRLPKSMIWYFFAVLAIGLFITEQSDLYYQMIVFNLLPLFMVLFVIQATSLMYAFVYFKKWFKFIPIVIVVLSLFPPVLFVLCLVGIMDILMPLRQRFFKI